MGKGSRLFAGKMYHYFVDHPVDRASVGISNVKMGENELQRAKQRTKF